jgi:hypothetical protein
MTTICIAEAAVPRTGWRACKLILAAGLLLTHHRRLLDERPWLLDLRHLNRRAVEHYHATSKSLGLRRLK